MHSIFNNRSKLPKELLQFTKIFEDANEKDIILKGLVLINNEESVVNNIDLETENIQSEAWFVPSIRNSYILYDHKFASPTEKINRIMVDIFLQRGFPSKYWVDSNFLASLAEQSQVTINKIIILNNDHSLKQQISTFSNEIGNLSVPNKKLCNIFYEHCQGSDTMEISLYDLLLKNIFPTEHLVDSQRLALLARKYQVTINKIIFYDENYLINKQISSFNNIKRYITVPNKQLCKLFYNLGDGGLDMEISLKELFKRNKFPREKIHTLSLEQLKNCHGFNDIQLEYIQTDRCCQPQKIDIENFVNYEYSYGKQCLFTSA